MNDSVRTLLPQLPATFTRRDICNALGYEPDRGSLFRLLKELVGEGSLRIESAGAGQSPARYRRLDG